MRIDYYYYYLFIYYYYFFLTKMVLNIPIYRMQEKMKFFKQQYTIYIMGYTMLLYIESTLTQYGLDLSKKGPLPC